MTAADPRPSESAAAPARAADPELDALASCVRSLARLDTDARARVLEYLGQRFYYNGDGGSEAPR